MSPYEHEVPLPPSLLIGTSADQRHRFWEVMRRGEIRKRESDGQFLVRADRGVQHIYLKPLQSADGELRVDARATLVDDEDLGDIHRARELTDMFSELEDRQGRFVLGTQFDSLARDLLANTDSVEVLRAHLAIEENADLRFYRIRTTKAMHARDIFWRIVAAAQTDGYSVADLFNRNEWPRADAVSGGLMAQPARLVVAPLVARSQPLAAVFMTSRGAEIVAVPPGAWNRVQVGTGWPTGHGGLSLSGSGQGIYESRFDTLPSTLAEEMIEELVRGANSLVGQLTDPAEWIDTAGQIDTQERFIAWSTIDFGLATLLTVGETWTSDESVWSAFRALTVLEGLWQGTERSRAVRLQDLLHPDSLRAAVVPAISHAWYQQWVADVVDNYQQSLEAIYPNTPMAESVDRVADIRHLLHGTGTDRQASRGRRLQALRGIKGPAGLALIRDVAVFWWMAVLLNPDSHARVGSAPAALRH